MNTTRRLARHIAGSGRTVEQASACCGRCLALREDALWSRHEFVDGQSRRAPAGQVRDIPNGLSNRPDWQCGGNDQPTGVVLGRERAGRPIEGSANSGCWHRRTALDAREIVSGAPSNDMAIRAESYVQSPKPL